MIDNIGGISFNWEEIDDDLISLIKLDRIEEALRNPGEYIKEFTKTTGYIGTEIALVKLKQTLEQPLFEMGLEWDDVKSPIELLARQIHLQDAVDNPYDFLNKLLDETGPVGKKITISKVKPLIEKELIDNNLEWDDIKPTLEVISDISLLKDALDDPNTFINELFNKGGPLGQKYILSKLEKSLKPILEKYNLSWEDVQPFIEIITDINKIQKGLDNPNEFVLDLLDKMDFQGTEILVENLHKKIGPVLEKEYNLSWNEVKPSVEMIANTQNIYKILDDPNAFIMDLIDTAKPIGKKVIISKLRPKIEDMLKEYNLEWEGELQPAIELLTDIPNLQKSLDNPDVFITELVNKAGPVGKKMIISNLRTQIEPMLDTYNLSWDEILPAIELFADLESLQNALDNPELFIEELLSKAGPAGKKIIIANLRPSIESELQKYNMTWENTEPVIEMLIDSFSDSISLQNMDITDIDEITDNLKNIGKQLGLDKKLLKKINDFGFDSNLLKKANDLGLNLELLENIDNLESIPNLLNILEQTKNMNLDSNILDKIKNLEFDSEVLKELEKLGVNQELLNKFKNINISEVIDNIPNISTNNISNISKVIDTIPNISTNNIPNINTNIPNIINNIPNISQIINNIPNISTNINTNINTNIPNIPSGVNEVRTSLNSNNVIKAINESSVGIETPETIQLR
tara:strand:- start:29 stop:2101 length:2073 start_codon:yes stop_codon:yes gene_type:complete